MATTQPQFDFTFDPNAPADDQRAAIAAALDTMPDAIVLALAQFLANQTQAQTPAPPGSDAKDASNPDAGATANHVVRVANDEYSVVLSAGQRAHCAREGFDEKRYATSLAKMHGSTAQAAKYGVTHVRRVY